MALVNMREMLEDARRRSYCVAAFDVCNYEMARNVVEVAAEERAPVILMGLKNDLVDGGMPYLSGICKTAANSVDVPVALHLDHAVDFDIIKQVIAAGFTSVMYDGSKLSLEENIARTKEVCDYAHRYDVTVEAELGHVTTAILGSGGQGETGLLDESHQENPDDYLTDPQEVEQFVRETGVDALAVAVGTVHGVYLKKPVMSFERLDEINKISTVPLVLHGGSGTPDDDIRRCVELGMCKLNIFSEILHAYNVALKESINKLDNLSSWPCVTFKEANEAQRELIRNKIRLCSSHGKV